MVESVEEVGSVVVSVVDSGSEVVVVSVMEVVVSVADSVVVSVSGVGAEVVVVVSAMVEVSEVSVVV